MDINISKDEIINFVMQSSDADNIIIATFIAGMQAKKNNAQRHDNDDRPPCRPPENRTA